MYCAKHLASEPVSIDWLATSQVGRLMLVGRPASLASLAIASGVMSGEPTIASCLRLVCTWLRPFTARTSETMPTAIKTTPAATPPYSRTFLLVISVSFPLPRAPRTVIGDAMSVAQAGFTAIRDRTEPRCGRSLGAFSGFPQQVSRRASSNELLAGVDDQDAHRRPSGRDVAIEGFRAVRRLIQLDAEEGKPAADLLANAGRALADPGREDERVDSPRGCSHRRDRACNAVLEDGEGQLGRRVAGLGRVLEFHCPAGSAAEPLDTGVDVESVVERVDVEARLSQQVQERAGIDRPGARVHRDTLQRAETHRRVHGAAVGHSGHGATAAEVADDDAKPRAAEESRGALHAPLDGEPVEAIATDAELLAPAGRDRIGGRLRRDRLVEARVENGDVRKAWKGIFGLGDRPEGGRVVERSQRLEREDLLADRIVDHHRLPKPWAAVDDAVRYRVEPFGADLTE